MESPKIQLCEHPLRGLPAYPTASLCGVAHKKLLLTYRAYAASQFFARALPSLEI